MNIIDTVSSAVGKRTSRSLNAAACIVAYLPKSLFQKIPIADDGRLARFALADTDDADDLNDPEDEKENRSGCGADDRPAQDHGCDPGQSFSDEELEGLSDVEFEIGALLVGEEGKDDAERAHEINEDRIKLVFRDVLSRKLGGVIGGARFDAYIFKA